MSTLPARLFGLGLLVLLAGCAQQREPGYYDTPRGNTESDARYRAQGGAATVAPSQLQMGFGQQEAVVTDPDTSPTVSTDTVPNTHAGPARQLPNVLADTRTYLGTLACLDGGSCPATRMTLTLAPDGQWRVRSTSVNDTSSVSTAMGCWFLTSTAPVRIVLSSGEQHYASLEFIQTNTLRVTRLNGRVPLLDSRLTRQADIDPIPELASQPAQNCPAH